MNKVLILSLKGYRGASFGGDSTSVIAVGGNDTQSTVGYNYSNYVVASVDLNAELPALGLIEIQSLTLKVVGSTASNPISSGLTTQVVLNNQIENPISLNPNSISTIGLSVSKIVSGINNVLLFSELTLTKQFIREITIEVEYRMLTPEELPDDGGKIPHYPSIPVISSMSGDVFSNYIYSSGSISLIVDSRAINHEMQIYQGTSSINSLLIKTEVFTGNTYPISLAGLNIPNGRFIYFRVRSRNYNGYSSWSVHSSPFIKIGEVTISLVSLSGSRATKISDRNYLAMDTVGFSFTVPALETSNNVTLILQHLYNGGWKDLDLIINARTPNAATYIIPLDLNNEQENGGLIEGEQREYRVCCKRGSHRDYSNSILITHNSSPKIIIGLNSSEERILSNGILKYSIIQEDDNISQIETTINIVNGSNLIGVATFLTTISNIKPPQTITIDLSSLKSRSWYIPGQQIKLTARGLDVFGMSSPIVECNTLYIINETLLPALVTPHEFYMVPQSDPKNFRVANEVHLKWEISNKTVLTEDPVITRIYRNGKLISDNLFDTEYVDNKLTALTIGESISYVIALWDGYEEVKSNPVIFAKSSAPIFKSGSSVSIKSVTTLTGNDYIALASDSEHSSPLMVTISWPMATSDNSNGVDIQYILYVVNHSSGTYRSMQLLNVVKDFVYNTVTSLINLSDFDCIVGNEIEILLVGVDRFGQQSAKLQIVG